jgi:hypothetical protein
MLVSARELHISEIGLVGLKISGVVETAWRFRVICPIEDPGLPGDCDFLSGVNILAQEEACQILAGY